MKETSTLRRIANVLMVIVNLLVGCGLVASAWSGHIEPDRCKYAVAMVFTFPAFLIAAVILFVLDLIWWRRTALLIGMAMLSCAHQINEFAPLNLRFGLMTVSERQRSFTLMTYNVYQFVDHEDPDGERSNPQLDYILAVRPDVVCIQEAEYFQPTIRNNITEDQLADIQQVYPYIFTSKEFTLLSKFRAEQLPFTFPTADFRSGDIMGWRLYIDDRIINLFGVHLRSLSYTQDERHLFRDITDGNDINKSDIKEARDELMPKLLAASKERAEQVRLLQGYIRKFGGENVIVCGDFNDPVGCYPLHMLETECDLRQAYADAGLGPTITYNANNFYFRIDHILYRGAMKAVDIERGSLKASDHYPLTATFVLDAQ